LLSRTDAALNATGLAQARALGVAFREVRWDRAFSSPMARARRTADLVLGARGDAPELRLDSRLVELDFGPYEGWSESDLEADELAVQRRRDGVELPGMESVASVEVRARSFFEELSESRGTTLVVGHGRMLRILLAVCVLRVPADVARNLRMRNCQAAVVEPGAVPLLLGLNVATPAR